MCETECESGWKYSYGVCGGCIIKHNEAIQKTRLVVIAEVNAASVRSARAGGAEGRAGGRRGAACGHKGPQGDGAGPQTHVQEANDKTDAEPQLPVKKRCSSRLQVPLCPAGWMPRPGAAFILKTPRQALKCCPCSCKVGAEQPCPPCMKEPGQRCQLCTRCPRRKELLPSRTALRALKLCSLSTSSPGPRSGQATQPTAGVLKHQCANTTAGPSLAQLLQGKPGTRALWVQLGATASSSPKPPGNKNNSGNFLPSPPTPPTKKLSFFSCPLPFNQNNYLFFFKLRFGYIQ